LTTTTNSDEGMTWDVDKKMNVVIGEEVEMTRGHNGGGRSLFVTEIIGHHVITYDLHYVYGLPYTGIQNIVRLADAQGIELTGELCRFKLSKVSI